MCGDREVTDYVVWRTGSGGSSQEAPCSVHKSRSLCCISRTELTYIAVTTPAPHEQINRMGGTENEMASYLMNKAPGVPTNSCRDGISARQNAGKVAPSG